jgi:hypothetical protein
MAGLADLAWLNDLVKADAADGTNKVAELTKLVEVVHDTGMDATEVKEKFETATADVDAVEKKAERLNVIADIRKEGVAKVAEKTGFSAEAVEAYNGKGASAAEVESLAKKVRDAGMVDDDGNIDQSKVDETMTFVTKIDQNKRAIEYATKLDRSRRTTAAGSSTGGGSITTPVVSAAAEGLSEAGSPYGPVNEVYNKLDDMTSEEREAFDRMVASSRTPNYGGTGNTTVQRKQLNPSPTPNYGNTGHSEFGPGSHLGASGDGWREAPEPTSSPTIIRAEHDENLAAGGDMIAERRHPGRDPDSRVAISDVGIMDARDTRTPR